MKPWYPHDSQMMTWEEAREFMLRKTGSGIIAANPTYYTTNEDSSWKVEYAKYFHKVTRRFEFEQELKARLVEITGQ